MPTRRSRITRLAKAAVLTTIALAIAPAASSAAVCPDVPSSPVLADFGDTNDYFLAPGGDFEGAPWSGRGLDRVEADKPWALAGSKALLIRNDKKGTSPEFCVSERHPHLRFFARGGAGGLLQVEALEGKVTTALVLIDGNDAWGLSGIVPLASALGYLGDESHNVQLRITALRGDWLIDGVYIDPYRR
jgi:hypothetical protein